MSNYLTKPSASPANGQEGGFDHRPWLPGALPSSGNFTQDSFEVFPVSKAGMETLPVALTGRKKAQQLLSDPAVRCLDGSLWDEAISLFLEQDPLLVEAFSQRSICTPKRGIRCLLGAPCCRHHPCSSRVVHCSPLCVIFVLGKPTEKTHEANNVVRIANPGGPHLMWRSRSNLG